MHRIGIPRALYYYRYYPFWKAFWSRMGFEVVLSSETSKRIINWGVTYAVDGTCLPVKAYYGHVFDLVQQGVDFLFIPQIVSIARREYICPKFMGLPDMIRHSLPDLPPIIAPQINANKGPLQIANAYLRVGYSFGAPTQVWAAYREGLRAQHHLERQLAEGTSLLTAIEGKRSTDIAHPRMVVALFGHEYLIHDLALSMGMITRLSEAGIRVVTPEQVPRHNVHWHSKQLPKRMFWTTGRQILGAFGFLNDRVDGIISLAAFACGTDSLTCELVERRAHRHGVPHLLLNIDEHSGEAGVITRVEAFVDMLERRKQREADCAAHG